MLSPAVLSWVAPPSLHWYEFRYSKRTPRAVSSCTAAPVCSDFCPALVQSYRLTGKSASGSNMDFRSDFETDPTDLLRRSLKEEGKMALSVPCSLVLQIQLHSQKF